MSALVTLHPMAKTVFPALLFVLLVVTRGGAMTIEERREHLQWMLQTLPAVPSWTEWQQQSGELPPDFDQLPRNNALPDPLRFLDGRAVKTEADWTARRAEIRESFERHMLGRFPPKPKLDRVEVLDETRGEGYLTRNVRLVFGPEGRASVRVRLTIPEGAGKFPVLLSPNLAGWAPLLIRRGYISAGYAGNDAMDDAAPLKDLYPDYDFAALPRRAWLASVVLDYLETVPQVEAKQIALYGYSRDGKMATMAAAFDERIAALIAGSTGVGGLLPWRLSGEREGGESIETTTRMFPTWLAPQVRFFAGREDRLPVDANLFLALIAPRPVLIEWGYNDEVANGWALEQAVLSVDKLHHWLGQPNNVGLLSLPGFHGGNDPEACIDWLDIQFNRSSRTWTNEFVFPWSFEDWRERTGERFDLAQFPERSASTRVSSLAEWEPRAAALRRSVQWMLGEAPPSLPTSGRRAPPPGGRVRPLPPGPTVIAQGRTGNPGQLVPDVPAWVISRGGQEFGWLEPEKNHVESRRIRFGHNVTGELYYPKDVVAARKLPVVIWLHGYNYPLGYMWVYRRDLHPILALVNAGFAVFAYDQTGFGSRWNEAARFYDRHPRWSQMGRMVEDVSAAVEALQEDSALDPEMIFAFGYTMGGTVGLYAAALDPRIKGVVSICGFTPLQTDRSENGSSGMTRYSHKRGLLPRLGLFAGHEAQLPFDYDDLISLMAPRPVLVVQPQMDRDADPAAVRAAVDRARRVYSLFGDTTKLGLDEPRDIARLTTPTQDRAIAWMKAHFPTSDSELQ